ncbi:MAG: phosphoribosylformylglycinamidine synthase subunit PurQ [Chloroflexi bacterium]|nr:phosphoribosylformylglycinamidine synthase subunit PurQ [Chloroflexota bacterium]
MKFGVVVFPGSNGDVDCYHMVKHVLGHDVSYVWYQDTDLSGLDCVLLPGGFSYGDYLRAGAIARFSPIMSSVEEFANAGGLVMGLCNGFQVLTESGLLPGALLRNDSLQFRCQWVDVRVEDGETKFTNNCRKGQVLHLPIAHGDGNYFADPETLERLERNGQVLVRYCNPAGETTRESNPNGSLNNIAGIRNEAGNVFGLMPHPERAGEKLTGGDDGLYIFRSILMSLGVPVA